MKINTGKLFKESFKGFNKDDVISFIDRLNKEHINIEEAFKTEINELKSRLKDAQEQNAEYEKMINEFRNQERALYDIESDENYIALKNENKRLNKEIDELKYINIKDGKSLKDFIDSTLNDLTVNRKDVAELQYIIKKLEEKSGVRAMDVYSADDDEDKAAIEKLLDVGSVTVDGTAELEKLNRELKAKNAEIESLNSKLEKLEIRMKDHDININITGDVKDDDQLYEKVAANLGKIIYFAQKEADITLAKAKIESATMTYEAKQEKIELTEKYNYLIAAAKENYNHLIQKFNILKEKIKDVYYMYDKEITQIETEIKENEEFKYQLD